MEPDQIHQNQTQTARAGAPPPAADARPPGADAQPAFTSCEQCGAPVDHDQRYCVNCGAHRAGVYDPAARYLSQGRVRGGRAGAAVRPGAGPKRQPRWLNLAAALALVLIPLALGLGVLVGRSSNNRDGQLLRALAKERAQVVTVASAAPAGAAAGAAGTSSQSASTVANKHKHAATRQHTKAAKQRTSTKSSGSASGSHAPSQSVGSSANKAQQAQGAQIVKKLQKTNGTGYLNQLPSQVSVP